MASATYSLIASTTLSSSQSAVTFSSIPSTYTDLVVRASIRDTETAGIPSLVFYPNNDSTTTIYSWTLLQGNGATASSSRVATSAGNGNFYFNYDAYASTTSNTFTSWEIYIPSYTVSQNKPISAISAYETNATTAYITNNAALWSKTNAISRLDFLASTLFASGSTFYLYGIKNA